MLTATQVPLPSQPCHCQKYNRGCDHSAESQYLPAHSSTPCQESFDRLPLRIVIDEWCPNFVCSPSSSPPVQTSCGQNRRTDEESAVAVKLPGVHSLRQTDRQQGACGICPHERAIHLGERFHGLT